MGAFVRAEGGNRPVRNIRFKKSGEWKEVVKAYINVNGNLRLWWPNFDDLTGESATPPVTLADYSPLSTAWNPIDNDFIVVTQPSTGQWFQYFDYPTKSESFVEEWSDYRQGSDISQGYAFNPSIVDAYAYADGSGFLLLDTLGLRRYLISEFGTVENEWFFVFATSPEIVLERVVEMHPTLTVGAEPIPAGGTYNPDGGGIAESNIGYINAVDGKDSCFGANQSIVVDPDEQYAYVLDARNQAIRKVSMTAPHSVATLAGVAPTGTRGTAYVAPSEPAADVDAVGLDARFKFRTTAKSSLAMHPSGDYLMVYQGTNGTLRRVWLRDVGSYVTGQVETWATNGNVILGSGIQPNRCPYLRDITFDPSGRWLYLVQSTRVLKVDMESADGTVTLVCGSTTSGYVDSPDPSAVRFENLRSVSVNSAKGWLLLTEHPSSGAHRIRFVF